LKDELKALSKEELIDVILQLVSNQERIEAKLRQYVNPNTPSSQVRFKPNTKKENADDARPRFPGRPEGHEGAGIRLPRPDQVIEHKLHKKGFVYVGKRTRTIIDFVDKPIIVTKHVIYQYHSPDGQLVEAPSDLSEGTYGKNLQAFLTLMRGISGTSHEKLSRIITSLRPDLTLCAATSQALTDNLAQNLSPRKNRLMHEIRATPYVNADETGLRQDGVNGYAWVFCTPTKALYEVDLSRGRDVPERVLGQDYAGIVARDGWNAYDGYRSQRCWVHLERELDALAEDNPELLVQSMHLKEIHKRAKGAKKLSRRKRQHAISMLNSNAELGHILNVLRATRAARKFATKLTNARPFLFIGVEHPEVPLDNNHAERTIRPIVVHRKMMGCIRNHKGERFIENVMSMMQTWHMQNKDVYSQLRHYAR
jgi:hypothetical protein